MTKTWVVLSDIQFPFHDPTVLFGLVVPFVQDLRPDGVILNGDITDCYAISDYTKSPFGPKDLQEEKRLASRLMSDLRGIPEKVWVGGNHEDRLRRYLAQHAKALATDPSLEFGELFRVKEHGFTYHPYGYVYELGKLLVTHGAIARTHSAFSAKANFDKYGRSVLVGHTHRLGAFYRRDWSGVHGAWENGCLCKLAVEWAQFPNWQQGFSVVHVDERTGNFSVQQLPVLPGPTLMYGGTKVTAGKDKK